MIDVAKHEAGHCIVGLSFGWKVEEMEVVLENDSGETRWLSECAPWEWSRSIPHARRALSVTVAGNVAEQNPISTLLKDERRLRPSEEDNYRAASQAFVICFETQPGEGLFHAIGHLESHSLSGGMELTNAMLAEIERAERRAEKILKRRRAELASLATALRENKTLNEGQIRRVLKRVKVAPM